MSDLALEHRRPGREIHKANDGHFVWLVTLEQDKTKLINQSCLNCQD